MNTALLVVASLPFAYAVMGQLALIADAAVRGLRNRRWSR